MQAERGERHDGQRDQHHRRHPARAGGGEVEPGLRHLIGADLPSVRHEADQSAEHRQCPEGHHDRGHVAPRHDEAVQQPAAEAGRARHRETARDPQRRMGVQHTRRNVG